MRNHADFRLAGGFFIRYLQIRKYKTQETVPLAINQRFCPMRSDNEVVGGCFQSSYIVCLQD